MRKLLAEIRKDVQDKTDISISFTVLYARSYCYFATLRQLA